MTASTFPKPLLLHFIPHLAKHRTSETQPYSTSHAPGTSDGVILPYLPHLTSTAMHLHKDLQRITGSQTSGHCCCSSVSSGVHFETAVGIIGKAEL